MVDPKELLHLNIADYVIIGIVFFSMLISVIRGFLKEAVSLIIWVVGFWVAIKFYNNFATLLAPYITSDSLRQIASFIVIFLVVLILGSLFSYLLSFLVVKTGLSGTDRLLGVVFGCARGVLLIAVLLLVISYTSFAKDHWWQESILIPHFQVLIDWLRIFLPEKMSGIVSVIN